MSCYPPACPCPNGKHFECVGGMCQCANGYQLSIDCQSCIPMQCDDANPHGSCGSGEQCYLGSCVGVYGCVDDKCYSGTQCKYTCENNMCVPSLDGPYGTSDCNGQCNPPQYTCDDSGQCIMATGGKYSTPTCNGTCTTQSRMADHTPVEFYQTVPTLKGKDVMDALLTSYDPEDQGSCPAGSGFLFPNESVCYKNTFASNDEPFIKNMAGELPIAFNRNAAGNGLGDTYVGTNFGNYNNQTELQVLFASESDKDHMSPYACAPPNSISDPYCTGRGSGAQCYPGLTPVMVSNGWTETASIGSLNPDPVNQKYYSVWGCSANPMCPEGYVQQTNMVNGQWTYGCTRVPPPPVANDDLCKYRAVPAGCEVDTSNVCNDQFSDLGYDITCCAGSLPTTCNSSRATDSFSKIYPGMMYLASNGTTSGGYNKTKWEMCSDPNGCDPSNRVKVWTRWHDDEITTWTPGTSDTCT